MERIKKLDIIIHDFIEKNYLEILFFSITVISLIMRVSFINIETNDYNSFLYKWFNEIKNSGGLLALGKEIGDYNIPYITIIALLTYLPIKPLISIKMVSIFFDYAMGISAIFIMYELFKNNKSKHIYALLAYSIVIILPSVVLNSSAWAQCDSIYTTFILLSLLFLIKEKNIEAFVFLGIAFSFKLQTIFVLPAFIIVYLTNKKFPFYYFFIIPIVNILLCLPAIIMGRGITSVINIYINQTTCYSNYISMNYPNIYATIIDTLGNSNLILSVGKELSNYGILFTMTIFVITAIIIIYQKIKIDNKMLINLFLWSTMICVFFLPSMHDRYMYIADIMSILFFIVNRKKVYIPIAINFISLYVYIEYIYATKSIPIEYIAILNFAIIIILTLDILDDFKIRIQGEKNT